MKNKRILTIIGLIFITGGAWVFLNNSNLFVNGYELGSTNEHTLIDNRDIEKKMVEEQTKQKPPKIGEEIGSLTIERIDAIIPIFHGTDENELEKGIGHFANSVLPGEKDNSVLSGHRDTVFRRLGEVEIGDSLIVTTDTDTFTYKVRKIRIVDEDDRTVIVPKARATLTLSTCYPFNFIGSAPERYILEAYLVE
ncbi:class D sortase [Oceanobacillus kimchii]|uniref:Sortase n=1 Tax=Oceanobacillus kimchii TaxID=746691 RepID=A0ABQ5TQF3_9BACI|nr:MULTISPECIES: class D sortase [Oceanobacillus]MCT1576853.1 class D sortase [Oceanobacillus kimchii]MCT2134923.1 class D sortase [Oceanobacillus kimchii]OEH56208.1 sortase [Oceanobacillus sp. E9]GLO67888.1 sortase [Oceanobacillus kimchii]